MKAEIEKIFSNFTVSDYIEYGKDCERIVFVVEGFTAMNVNPMIFKAIRNLGYGMTSSGLEGGGGSHFVLKKEGS